MGDPNSVQSKWGQAEAPKIAFIGCGNMAKAILKGLLLSKTLPAGHVQCTVKSSESLKALKQDLPADCKVYFAHQNAAVAQWADVIILG